MTNSLPWVLVVQVVGVLVLFPAAVVAGVVRVVMVVVDCLVQGQW